MLTRDWGCFHPLGMGVNSYRKVVVALMVGWEGSGQINRPSLTRGGSGSGVTGWLGCRGVWAL